MQRHAFFWLALLIAFPAAANAAPTKQWQFDVLLDGKPIGYHTFNVQQEGARQVLDTEASFDVKFLFVTAFRYRHRNTEVWNNGCLSSIEAVTNSNGRNLEVLGSMVEDGFELTNTGGNSTLSGCVQSFAYWNPAVLDSQRLLNSQTGDYENVSVTLEDRDKVQVAGQAVDALRYRLSAKAGDITLWYSVDDRTWLGLEAPAKGGRRIRYQAVAIPQADETAQLQAGRN